MFFWSINHFFMVKYNILFLVCCLSLSVLIVILLWLIRKVGSISWELNINRTILNGITIESSIEKHLNEYLELLFPIIESRGYFFYLYDTKSENYLLRVSRQVDKSTGKIAPSYSGLIPYNREVYNPPLWLPRTNSAEGPLIIKDGGVPLLHLMIREGEGLIRIGPVRSAIGKTRLKKLEKIARVLQPSLAVLLSIEKQKFDTKLIVTTAKAINGLAKSVFDINSLFNTLISLSAKMIDAEACCFLLKQDNNFVVSVISGFKKEVETQLKCNQQGLHELFNIVKDVESCQILPSTYDFQKIPTCFSTSSNQLVTLIRIDNFLLKGVIAFWHNQDSTFGQHQISIVKDLILRIGELFDSKRDSGEFVNAYSEVLSILIEANDNLEPFTVGHSNLIANYSVAIARELKLPQDEIPNIKLAAYFHDIGMIGLSNNILFKRGKYSKIEFETMKLHAEIGASIGESAFANTNVPLYIRHHHERWDGFGYPDGLSGEEIPLGSRIIAVADMFNAKLGGRKYREPVTFEQAIKDMISSAGTQLDPKVVQALVEWFKNKQTDHKRIGRSLGPCWLMRCSPASICKECNAFNRRDKNCWEFKDVNCSSHGNNCTTCFVRTETIYRSNEPQFCI
ncbi:cyclic di-GMP phosphodiesterase response regulator RpfG [Desulfosporosinus acididurans]|uniref:Cyclic di-GMP phosphodiesterase response regulator RpfG n=1 Tax=Desulfosporosinus acididurans TaxID=476652 RepID=A0A0J1FTX1_9FIRM|nr:HD-GYP domain-containing protein [Desulfosporosinus acididurans]KLU66433.1 cyclic di-GMP phosphodiesterase response regulator RpfG [Desulfosporosinus acididurans]